MIIMIIILITIIIIIAVIIAIILIIATIISVINTLLIVLPFRTQRARIRELVQQVFPERDDRPSNARLLEPAGIVSWGGFSLTLACMYGMAAAIQWDDDWDYFINLSTADFPVLTQVNKHEEWMGGIHYTVDDCVVNDLLTMTFSTPSTSRPTHLCSLC